MPGLKEYLFSKHVEALLTENPPFIACLVTTVRKLLNTGLPRART
jgi:hypothetical protein